MNKENKPIEDLFNDAFEHFEKTPSSGVWSGIQAGINGPASGAAGAGSAKAAMSIGTKIGIAIATVAVIGAAVYLTTTSNETTTANLPTETTLSVAEKTAEGAVADDLNTLPSSDIAMVDEEKPTNQGSKQQAQQQTINNTSAVKVNRLKQTVAPTNNAEGQVEKESLTDKIANAETISETTKESKTTEKPASSASSDANDDIKADNTQEVKEESSTKEVALAAVIQVNTLSGDVPFDLTFGTAQEADSYTWKLNGAVISHNKNSAITIDQEGTQQLELTVKKDNQSAQSIQVIEGIKPTVTIIPNIFTPNKDGINDVFRIEGDFDQLSIKVLDKNYKELHNWTGEYGFWDGTYPDGSMAPNGVYFYMGTYKKDGKQETLKGSITLKR